MKALLETLAPLWQPHAGQREFLLNPAKFKVLACGRRWGKTDVCAVLALAGLMTMSPLKQLIIAPTLAQANLIFGRVAELAEGLGYPVKVRSTPFPTMRRGPAVITARSAHVPRSLRGNEAGRIIVDEAAFLPEATITEVAMPMLAVSGGELVLISTPNGQNHFWRFFQMGRSGEFGFWSQHAPSEESPFVNREFLAVQRKLLTDRAYAIEYLAEFRESAGRVFSGEMIEAALVADGLPLIGGPYSIGVDWGERHDFTAVVVLAGSGSGAELIHMEKFNQDGWFSLAERVAAITSRFEPHVIASDAQGAGAVATQMLKELVGLRWIVEYAFSRSSKDKLVNDLCALMDRRRLRIPCDPDLIRELQHFERSERGRTGGTGGYHDDLVIALGLAVQAMQRQYSSGIAMGPQRDWR